ncbi:hypothetical protein [Cellulomonas sp. KH9]|uniref:hypothetical protein n=1 Tax=Cellulomonas sp. KH9 TaxID=1855324 RepID=UPI0008EC1C16|nr:hypothetical protein [Cellulomonas sp. KH9]SFJ69463.1 hypothetical protein SAMN05216467_0529 [Cellulomonas sp. KH9]
MSVETRSVLTAVLAAVVAVAGFAGVLPLAAVSAVLVLVLALGWPGLAALPFTPGAGAVVALGGLGSVAAVTFTPEQPYLQHLALVLAAAVVLAFVNEMLRRDGRLRMVESVSGTVAGTVLAVCVTGWVATARLDGGEELVVAGAVALALGSASVALRGRTWLVYLVTVVAATAGGTLVGWLLPTVQLVAGAVLGVGVGVLVTALHALFDRLPALERRLPSLAVVVLPVTVSGVLVYVAGRVLAG